MKLCQFQVSFHIMTVNKVFEADRARRIINMNIIGLVSDFARPHINTRLVEGNTRSFIGRQNKSEKKKKVVRSYKKL